MLERSQAAWRNDGARYVEAARDRQEQETAMWRQRGGEALKAIRDEATRVEAEQIARSYGVRLADDDRRRSGWSSRAKRRISWTSERCSERSDSCHPYGGLTRPKRAPRMSIIPEESGRTASISRQVSAG